MILRGCEANKAANFFGFSSNCLIFNISGVKAYQISRGFVNSFPLNSILLKSSLPYLNANFPPSYSRWSKWWIVTKKEHKHYYQNFNIHTKLRPLFISLKIHVLNHPFVPSGGEGLKILVKREIKKDLRGKGLSECSETWLF